MNYKEAEKLAQRLSLDYLDEDFYVNWIEGYEYCVNNTPESDSQPFYKNGIFYYNEADYEYETLGYHQVGQDNDYNN